MRHFHETAGSNETNDPAAWDWASYSHHPCDDLEPLPDIPNPYREAALYHLGIMLAVDQFVETAKDARFAIIVVAIVLKWPSARSWTLPEIAEQLGCSPLTITRASARFREMAGLGVSAGGIRFIRSGAGS